MSRFEQEISGALGEFWKNNAQAEVDRLIAQADRIEVESDGAAKWLSNGRYIPSDVCEKLVYGGFDFSPEATARKRDAQETESIEAYRKAQKNRKRSAEELFEMRAAFGTGTTIVDVITGETITL